MEIEEQIQDSIDEMNQPQQIIMDGFQLPLVTNALLTNQIMGTNSPLLENGLTNEFSYQFPPSYQIAPHALQQQSLHQDRQLQIFWANQLREIKATNDFKNHNLPLARIKKIMKADEDVKMIAAETPVLFSRACEMFILELTHRSWSQAEHSKRRTLQKTDISSSIAKFQVFDFLIDIIPMEEVKDGGMPSIPAGEVLNNESIPCFYDPSKFGSLMMDMRHPEIVSHGLSYTQQHHGECIASANRGAAEPNFADYPPLS